MYEMLVRYLVQIPEYNTFSIINNSKFYVAIAYLAIFFVNTIEYVFEIKYICKLASMRQHS